MRCAGVVQSGHGAVGWGARTRKVIWAVVASTAHASRHSVAVSGNKRVKMGMAGVEMKAVFSFQRCCLWGNARTVSHRQEGCYAWLYGYMRYNREGSQDIPEWCITKIGPESNKS